MMTFTHPMIVKNVPKSVLDKYEIQLQSKSFQYFCQKCSRLVNHSIENTYEDQIVKILLLRYFFLT